MDKIYTSQSVGVTPLLVRFWIAVLRQTAIFHGNNLSHQFRKILSDAHLHEKCLEVYNVYTDIIVPNADVLLVGNEPDFSLILTF